MNLGVEREQSLPLRDSDYHIQDLQPRTYPLANALNQNSNAASR